MTTILEHRRRGDRHFDWLLDLPSPSHPDASGCLTLQTPVHPALWAGAPMLHFRELPPHRRFYLSHQGPVSGGRGWVRQATRGWAQIELATPRRMVIALETPLATLRTELRCIAPFRWRGA